MYVPRRIREQMIPNVIIYIWAIVTNRKCIRQRDQTIRLWAFSYNEKDLYAIIQWNITCYIKEWKRSTAERRPHRHYLLVALKLHYKVYEKMIRSCEVNIVLEEKEIYKQNKCHVLHHILRKSYVLIYNKLCYISNGARAEKQYPTLSLSFTPCYFFVPLTKSHFKLI